MKNKTLISVICILAVLLLAAPFSYAWFADSLQSDANIESYVHKSYFESGDGTAARQFAGSGLSDDDACAYEIKYPVQLYYFAWLQALGYFNQPEEGETEVAPTYFYLSQDLDMSGWILPQIGTQEYPFIGNFDGNGHTISNLTVQNAEGTGDNAWTDKPEDINGLNIVGFFGVVGGLGGAGAAGQNYALPGNAGTAGNYTYATATNEVKNFTLVDATVKTDLAQSLAGIAAGYVNGTMENVKVVGGTLHSTATTALTYTANLSDYGAVGYCTDTYKDSNTVTTVLVYDPQVYSNANGSAQDQGNNWGNSINMQSMYEDLLSVYNGYSATISNTPAGKNIITVTKTGDEVTGISVEGNGEPVSTTYAGGRTYNLRVVEKKDGSDTVSYFSLVERNASFMYLYGGKTFITEDVDEAAYCIHTGEVTPAHYLTLNTQLVIADAASTSDNAKWIIKDGKIYTVREKTVVDPDAEGGSYTEDWLYYLIKNGSNQLEIVEVSQIESLPASVTGTTWAVGEDTITTGGYALVYKNGSWQLEQASTYITDNAEENYLSLNNSHNIVNQTSSASATSWTKETSGSGFKLSAMVNGTKCYLNCSSGGALSAGTDEASATVWYEDTSVAGRYKVYMLTTESSGFALYYDGSDWNTTGYTIISSGNDWGGSISIRDLNHRIFDLLNTNTLTGRSAASLSTIIEGQAIEPSSGKHRYYKDGSNSVSMSEATNSWFYTNPDNVTLQYYLESITNPSTGYVYDAATANKQTGTTFPLPRTILPLLVDSNNTVLHGNTGYIVGGDSESTTTAYTLRSTVRTCTVVKGQIWKSLGTATYGAASTDYDKSRTAILTNSTAAYGSSNFNWIEDSINEGITTSQLHSEIRVYSKIESSALGSGYEAARVLFSSTLETEGRLHGLYFCTKMINTSSPKKCTADSVWIYDQYYENYELLAGSVDFNVKHQGYVRLFAGSYDNSSGNADAFFRLYQVFRNNPSHPEQISAIKEVSKVYENTDSATRAAAPYVYLYTDGSYSTGVIGDLLFDMQYLWSAPPVHRALYYFQIPVNGGCEYALGSASTTSAGAKLLYLDISASAAIEGDSKIVESMSSETKHTDAGDLSYTEVEPTETDAPTYFPLAWDRYGEGNAHDYRGDLPASTNTGYVISGANTSSAIPGDIRVSQYTKYATGNWASIRNSLTSTNNAGILNDANVYTIIDGTQVSVGTYGIGKMHTMQYGNVSKTVNALLQGNQYVYGLHFMNAQISKDKLVTVPKAVINEVTKTNYKMPQDCIDFQVATKGRIAFMAGTYYSGSNGVQSFFSLHRIFRNGSDNITDIKQLSEIYSDGDASHGYIYRYKDDANYYNADGSLNGASVPSGYTKVYDLRAIDDPNGLTGNASLTQNSVYYFEIPVDAGEYALGSSDTDGAYLIYLDIAANASFAVETTTTEVTEQTEYTMNYPKGVAFVDEPDSTAFDDVSDKADPSKSVFVSIPVGANANGDTTFSITSAAAMTVTNGSSSLTGAAPQSIPLGGTLLVNGTPMTMDPSRRVIIEKVTSVTVDLGGTTTTTVTTTTQTTENGSTTTTVVQTVTTEFNGTTTTTTTSPAPTYDGHTLIPNDLTVTPSTTANVILRYSYTGSGLTNTVTRNGDLNAVLTDVTLTVGLNEYTVYEVENDTGAGIDAGRYDVTITGTAGTYSVNVEQYDNEFVFYINNVQVTSTGNRSVTVAAGP